MLFFLKYLLLNYRNIAKHFKDFFFEKNADKVHEMVTKHVGILN